MNDDRNAEPLGSLAQSARRSSLGQARGILIAIGILSLVVNVAAYFVVAHQVEDAKAKLGPNAVLNQQVLNEIQHAQAINLAFAALGVVFVVLGLLVYRAPVAITVMGLLLYLAGAVFSVISADPKDMGRGIIIKILIVVALAKAVQTAIAYEKEARDDADTGPPKLDF